MRRFKIALVAPLWIRVPPVGYGGTEWIVYHLANELTRRGHDVTLFASGNSLTKSRLVAGHRTNLLADGIPWSSQFYSLLHLSRVFARAKEFDLIHSHVDLWETFFAQHCPVPVVHTMHNPLYSIHRRNLRLQILNHSPWSNFVTISDSQYRLGSVSFHRVATVHNGVDLAQFRYQPKADGGFIWIARVNKSKGIENAITAARRAHAPLTMAGRLDPTQRPYFARHIRPYLNRDIRFIGEITARQKSAFYGNAKALLYPIEWHEPFGLVMAEAMACGTPVIAFDRGSVREVVRDGVTGFVVRTIPEVVRAMSKVHTLSRLACRRWVEKKFSVNSMVDGYEAVYEKLLRQHRRRR